MLPILFRALREIITYCNHSSAFAYEDGMIVNNVKERKI